MLGSVRSARWIASAALVLASALSAQVTSAAAQDDGTAGAAPDNGFSATGPWNTPLPANVPLAPNSQAIVNNLLQDKQNSSGLWAINTDTYSAPIYTVGPDTPRQQWTYSDCQNMPQLAPVIADSLASVPTPPGMLVSQGTDAAVAIYQPSTDTYWDFWRAHQDDDGNTAGADFPCEGQRFRLDPAFDVNTLIDPAARTVARAMQQYGLILTDSAGALVTQAEDPRAFAAVNGGVDPYNQLFDPTGTGLLPESLTRYLVLAGIPLNRLQALPLNYGEPGH